MDTIATIAHVGDARFDGTTASGHTVRTEGGDHETGPGPMELVLVALGSCSAVTVVEFLNKMRQPFTSLHVEISGERAENPPRVYTRIHARYLVGGDVGHSRVERAIALTETKYCSVWTTLEQTAEMTHSIEFV